MNEQGNLEGEDQVKGEELIVQLQNMGYLAVNRCHDHNNSNEGKYLIGVGLQFKGLACHHHGRKHDGMQIKPCM